MAHTHLESARGSASGPLNGASAQPNGGSAAPTLFHKVQDQRSILALVVSDGRIYAGSQGGEILVTTLETFRTGEGLMSLCRHGPWIPMDSCRARGPIEAPSSAYSCRMMGNCSFRAAAMPLSMYVSIHIVPLPLLSADPRPGLDHRALDPQVLDLLDLRRRRPLLRGLLFGHADGILWCSEHQHTGAPRRDPADALFSFSLTRHPPVV
jgi:hypothetical protein